MSGRKSAREELTLETLRHKRAEQLAKMDAESSRKLHESVLRQCITDEEGRYIRGIVERWDLLKEMELAAEEERLP